MKRLTVTLGIPGAGKSTWWAPRRVATLLRGDRGGGGTPGVIVDGCGTQPHYRRGWLRIAREANATSRLVAFPCTTALACARSRSRPPECRVPAPLIARYQRAYMAAIRAAQSEPWGEIITIPQHDRGVTPEKSC